MGYGDLFSLCCGWWFVSTHNSPIAGTWSNVTKLEATESTTSKLEARNA
jgi:hypothetical protein